MHTSAAKPSRERPQIHHKKIAKKRLRKSSKRETRESTSSLEEPG
jgi:hypothetical protein